ncbi:Aromatic-ring hydroxylase-like protein [Metarhizium rileyi]|uniref:Aromatic-ring hydroxylase-like protein n=1 Tax=Metarhizium rileyi (strain RCEF 4871) TaxID=1649241 RepID=A0A167B865_METRR|nr:Aromatic-ring hydroxylase-like protein [Metarhizium rileyi RCEF 4871]
MNHPASASPKQFTVTIVGGGIGGVILAIGLLRRNVRVQIYEAATAFGETGLGLSISPAAHRALPLIDPHIREVYDSLVTTHADSPGYEEFRQTWFEVLWATGPQADETLMDLKALPSGQTSVRRADFLLALVGMVPQNLIHFGKRLQNIDQVDDEIQLFFEDGTSVAADVVVGCDGIKSRVRHSILSLEELEKAKPRFSGMYCYRAVLDMDTVIEAVGDRRARLSTWYIGKGGYGITYPIQRVKKVNIGLYKSCETWNNEDWIREATRKDMERDFGHMGKYVNRLIKHMPSTSQWAVFEHPNISTYFNSRLAILGDAAHASTPHQGAGAGQAIEDAHVLAELLADPSVTSKEHVESVFHAYDAVRRPRSQQVVAGSREIAETLCLSCRGIGDDADKLKETWQERFHWLWDIDLQEQVDNARQIMLQRIGKKGAAL